MYPTASGTATCGDFNHDDDDEGGEWQKMVIYEQAMMKLTLTVELILI